MKPEQLKKLAEAMGKSSAYSTKDKELIVMVVISRTVNEPLDWEQFNPDTNPAQLLEVLEWLLGREWNVTTTAVYVDEEKYVVHKGIDRLHSESLTDAILQAAEKGIGE